MFKSIFYTKRFSCYDTVSLSSAGHQLIVGNVGAFAAILTVWAVSLFVIDGIYKNRK